MDYVICADKKYPKLAWRRVGGLFSERVLAVV